MESAELSIRRVAACSCTFIPWMKEHPVSLSCAEAQLNAGLVIQSRCSILSATQTVLFGSEKFLSHLSTPVAQNNCSQ